MGHTLGYDHSVFDPGLPKNTIFYKDGKNSEYRGVISTWRYNGRHPCEPPCRLRFQFVPANDRRYETGEPLWFEHWFDALQTFMTESSLFYYLYASRFLHVNFDCWWQT